MSNRDPDTRYERSLAQVLRFCFHEEAKLIHTAIPGTVLAYDATTKRATVQSLVGLLIAEEDAEQPGEEVLVGKQRPHILNVPVRQVATGGHMMHQQIDAGDVVLLIFSERGIETLKEQWGEHVDPPQDAFFAERDALAIPWGREDVTPVRSTGWIVQAAKGMMYVSADGDTIRLVTGDVSVVLTPTAITLTGPTDTMVIP